MDIVIIDDHNIIIEGIEMLLSLETNINILKTYNDGNAFLKDLRANVVEPEIILMDLMMPTINGFECSKILHQEFPDLKIIILSMNCEDKVIHELINTVGISGYLSKKNYKKRIGFGVRRCSFRIHSSFRRSRNFYEIFPEKNNPISRD